MIQCISTNVYSLSVTLLSSFIASYVLSHISAIYVMLQKKPNVMFLPASVSINEKSFFFLLLSQDGLAALCCQQSISSELPGPEVNHSIFQYLKQLTYICIVLPLRMVTNLRTTCANIKILSLLKILFNLFLHIAKCTLIIGQQCSNQINYFLLAVSEERIVFIFYLSQLKSTVCGKLTLLVHQVFLLRTNVPQ